MVPRSMCSKYHHNGSNANSQSTHLLLLDEFVTLHLLLSQDLILFSHMIEFFFSRHVLTLLGLSSFDEPPENLGCYKEYKFFRTL